MIELARRLPMAALLRFQDRLIRRDQALAAGLTRTAIDGHLRHGRWRRLLPSVYETDLSVTDQEILRSRQFIRAAWMWLATTQ